MSFVSSIYLIIFLPLLSSLFCQLIYKKSLSFLVALSITVVVFFLTLNTLPQVLVYEKIDNDFFLSPLSIILEFKLDIFGIIFLLSVIFIKLIALIYYRCDIKKLLDQNNEKFFYSAYLLHLFALIGIFSTNNLFNLFLFFEIYGFSFFAISLISKNLKNSRLSLRYFYLNVAFSLIILFCFFVIYLSFGETNFSNIAEVISLNQNLNPRFLSLIYLLLSISFVVKFFPFWLYFEYLKTTNSVSNFFLLNSLFIKTNIGIFVILKFSYLFFSVNLMSSNFDFAPFIIFVSLILIFYSAIKIYKQKHIKAIILYSSLSNLGFILASFALQNFESLQALFFFILNFNLVVLVIFISSNFFKNRLNLIGSKNSLILAIKLMIFFIAAFPFSTLFFANWYLAYASFNFDFTALLLPALIISNFAQVSAVIKIINNFSQKDILLKNNKNFSPLSIRDIKDKHALHENRSLISIEHTRYFITKNHSFHLVVFWFSIIIIYLSVLMINFTNNFSLKFASFLY